MSAQEPTSSRPVAVAAPRLVARGDKALARRRRGKWLRRAVAAVAIIAVAGGLALALRPAPITAETARATRGGLTVTVDEVSACAATGTSATPASATSDATDAKATRRRPALDGRTVCTEQEFIAETFPWSSSRAFADRWSRRALMPTPTFR